MTPIETLEDALAYIKARAKADGGKAHTRTDEWLTNFLVDTCGLETTDHVIGYARFLQKGLH